MAHVLLMAAGELGDPLAVCVQMEIDDRTLHPVSVRAVLRVTFANAGPRGGVYLRDAGLGSRADGRRRKQEARQALL